MHIFEKLMFPNLIRVIFIFESRRRGNSIFADTALIKIRNLISIVSAGFLIEKRGGWGGGTCLESLNRSCKFDNDYMVCPLENPPAPLFLSLPHLSYPWILVRLERFPES